MTNTTRSLVVSLALGALAGAAQAQNWPAFRGANASGVAEGGKPPPERPVWFMKLPGAIVPSGDLIRLPAKQPSTKVDYEAELAIVLGRECHNATRANALDFVLGYTCANDVSARDWQRDFGGGQWNHAKSFDTFCPLGPVLVTKDEIPQPNALRIRSLLKSELTDLKKQWGKSPMPSYKDSLTATEIDELIAYLASLRGAR